MLACEPLPRGRQAWNRTTRRPWKMADVTDKMVICAFNDAAAMDGVYAYDLLMALVGCPFKVAYRAMERACDRGYISFGVSLRTGWVTDKGLQLFGILAATSSDTVIIR